MKLHTDWKRIQWDAVKGVADNQFTRVVILIPIAGYLILFNDEIASLASFDALAGVGDNDASPFLIDSLSKLRLVFFGSLSVLLSSIIFRVFSPDELKTANSDLEFSELVRERYSVHEIVRMEESVYLDTWTERTEAFWIFMGQTRAKKAVVAGFRPDFRAKMFSMRGDYISFRAREWWVGQMHTYRPARISSGLLGVLSYLMLTIPTLDIAQAVIRHLVKSLF